VNEHVPDAAAADARIASLDELAEVLASLAGE